MLGYDHCAFNPIFFTELSPFVFSRLHTEHCRVVGYASLNFNAACDLCCSDFVWTNVTATAECRNERKKLKLSLYKPWRYIGEVQVYFHSFLTSKLVGGVWSSRPDRFILGYEPRYRYHRRVGCRTAGMGVLEKGKLSCVCRDSKLGLSNHCPSLCINNTMTAYCANE